MKTHEITTIKGEFVVLELNNNSTDWIFTSIPILGKTATHDSGFSFKYSHVFKLSEATEDDAKLIVDNGIFKGFYTFEDWGESENPRLTLECLLKSKGIDVNNGNWYLFKKI